MNQEPATAVASRPRRGRLTVFLDVVERAGNRLPDQVTIFASLAGLTLLCSWLCAAAGVSTRHPVTQQTMYVFNLLSRDGVQWVFSSVVKNFTDFAPLGTVLVAMIGVGVADRTGLFAALLKALVTAVPRWAITPTVIFAGILSNTASDAGYVILPPLAAMLYVGLGRHPLAGICTAFAGVGAGFSANLLLGTLDPMLAGLTQEAARLYDPRYNVYATANYYFMAASVGLLTLVGWFVAVRIVEPRFGPWHNAAPTASDAAPAGLGPLSRTERRGLLAAGAAVVAVLAAVVCLVAPEDGVLRQPGAAGIDRYRPFFNSLVGLMMLMFIVPGLVYGIVTRQIRSDREAAKMMSDTMGTMGRYIVMAFFAGQFIAWFKRSGLGLILAVEGAGLLKTIHLTGVPLLVGVVLLTATFNLLMSSASAKWAVMAPIFVPMLMVLGQSPETTQVLYRVGDSTTNVITPLSVYIPIVLSYCHRYVPTAGLGTLIAAMIPFSLAFLAAWCLTVVLWVSAGIPVGPGAPLEYPA